MLQDPDPDNFPHVEKFMEWIYENDRFLTYTFDELKTIMLAGENSFSNYKFTPTSSGTNAGIQG